MKKITLIFVGCLFFISLHVNATELNPGNIVTFKQPADNTPYYAACKTKRLAYKVVAYYSKKKYQKYDRFITNRSCIQCKSGARLIVVSSDNEFAEVKFMDSSITGTLWITQYWIRRIN